MSVLLSESMLDDTAAERRKPQLQGIIERSHITVETIRACIDISVGIEYLAIVAVSFDPERIPLLNARKVENKVNALA